jgi:hypothetical protein
MELDCENTDKLQSNYLSCKARSSLESNERTVNYSILRYNISSYVSGINQSQKDVGIESDLQKNDCMSKDICNYQSVKGISDNKAYINNENNQKGNWLGQFKTESPVPVIFNQNTKRHYNIQPQRKVSEINKKYGDIYGKYTPY